MLSRFAIAMRFDRVARRDPARNFHRIDGFATKLFRDPPHDPFAYRERQHDQHERQHGHHHKRCVINGSRRIDRRLRRRAALFDERIHELFQLACCHQQRDIHDADLPVHLRQIERLLLHQFDEGAQVGAPRADRRRQALLVAGRVRVVLQVVLPAADIGERMFDIRAEFVALLRGGRGEQHLLRAARTQHGAAQLFNVAAGDIPLAINGFRRAVEPADLRQRNHADNQRADQQQREREAQRCLDGQRTAARGGDLGHCPGGGLGADIGNKSSAGIAPQRKRFHLLNSQFDWHRAGCFLGGPHGYINGLRREIGASLDVFSRTCWKPALTSPKAGVHAPGVGSRMSVSRQNLAGQCVEDTLKLSAHRASVAL